jgi:hypothetical protein
MRPSSTRLVMQAVTWACSRVKFGSTPESISRVAATCSVA